MAENTQPFFITGDEQPIRPMSEEELKDAFAPVVQRTNEEIGGQVIEEETVTPVVEEETVTPVVEEEATPVVEEEATPVNAELVIPEKPVMPSMRSVVQDYNKVDMDIEKIRGFDLKTPEIARYLVENLYKFQDENGEYQNLPDGFYDELRKNGIPDQEILSTFANLRNLSGMEQFREEAAKDATVTGGFISGATLGGMTAGVPGFIIGGITGALMMDTYRRMAAPDTEIPYAEKSGLATAGGIVGGSAQGLSIPWLAKDSAISLGSEFIRNNLQKLPLSAPVANTLARGERFLDEGFQAARNAPRSYLMAESRDIGTAASVGYLTEELRPGDRGGVNVAGDVLAETAAVIADPIGRVGRLISNKLPVIRGLVEGLSPERRALSAGMRLRRILEEAGENPDELIPKLLAGEGEFQGNDYTSLLDEAGIDFSDRTAALQTGVPILYFLESAGLKATRAKKGIPNEYLTDFEIQERHLKAQQNFNQFLADLIKMDTPEALGLFADLRNDNYRQIMNTNLTEAFDRYQSTVNKALEGGETLDTARVLYNTMFGEDGNSGVYGDIQRQGQVLKNLIPKDVEVPTGALEIPETEALSGEGLIDVYNRIGKEASIRGQRPRISYGKDLVSLDKVLKEFDIYVNPEKYAKEASDVPELGGVQQDLPGLTVLKPEVDFDDSVSTGELLNFLDAIDQSKKQALRSSNQPLLELLTQLENGARNTLAQTSIHRNVTTRGGQFRRFFDNYLAYRDEASNVFSNAFLGEMRTTASPELAGLILFKGMGNPTILRLQQMDDAANFLLDYDSRGGVLTTFNEDVGAIPGPRQIDPETNLSQTGPAEILQIPVPPIPQIRSAQDKVLRGILSEARFFKRTPLRDSLGELTGEITIEPTEAFNTFMADPVNQNILAEYFPVIKGDLEDIGKTRALFNALVEEEGLLAETISNSDAFATLFEGVYDNPIAKLQTIIGTPGSTRILGYENPVSDLTKVAKIVADAENPRATQGFIDTVINHGYTYAGGFSPIDLDTGSSPFNLEKFREYLFSPMVPGRRDSVADVLRDTGILEGGNAHLAKITQILNEMDKIQKAISPARGSELGSIADPDLANRIQMQVTEAGVGAIGAGIASNFYGLLVKAGVVGGAGSLISSALGARVFRDVIAKNPAILAQQLMTEAIKRPELMADLLEMTQDYVPGAFTKLPSNKLKRMYTFLLGGGLVPATMGFREFSENYYGRSMPEQRRAESEEAGAAPMIPDAVNPRRVAPNIVPPAETVPAPLEEPVTTAPVPVVQAAPPMAPPAQQVAQAPASADQRSRYAAMFPNDMASGIIRQGIGSLG